MEALIRVLRAAVMVSLFATVSWGASFRTDNFMVTARTKALAREIAEAAERYRSDLAVAWLGRELPRWSEPCPIEAKVSERLGAGGATSFLFATNAPAHQFRRPVTRGDGLFQARPVGRAHGWDMSVQGSRERVLDSVLPHEVTHTIFATHFGRPLPRWADEGACTTVEHESEKAKQHDLLYEFLNHRPTRGIAFNEMFSMTEYPDDILPLYAQGFSLARFLIYQGGRRKFVSYIGDGLDTNDWTAATKYHYGFENLSDLQLTWQDWVREGSPAMNAKPRARENPSATLLASRSRDGFDSRGPASPVDGRSPLASSRGQRPVVTLPTRDPQAMAGNGLSFQANASSQTWQQGRRDAEPRRVPVRGFERGPGGGLAQGPGRGLAQSAERNSEFESFNRIDRSRGVAGPPRGVTGAATQPRRLPDVESENWYAERSRQARAAGLDQMPPPWKSTMPPSQLAAATRSASSWSPTGESRSQPKADSAIGGPWPASRSRQATFLAQQQQTGSTLKEEGWSRTERSHFPATSRQVARPEPNARQREVLMEWGTPSPFLAPEIATRPANCAPGSL